MYFQQYLDEMKIIQEDILVFLENNENNDENYENLIRIFDDQGIYNDQHKLRSLFHLITSISNNHHRGPNFFNKIEQILKIFQKDIKNYFTNDEIFSIFKKNRRLLLFLIDEKIIILDDIIMDEMRRLHKYWYKNVINYFAPEFKSLKSEESLQKDEWLSQIINKDLPENFYELRKKGENDNYICQLIQKDMIKEFIVHINQNELSLETKIEPSIYETNNFLLEKEFKSHGRYNENKLTLIEYATFCGSIQIVKYLQINGVNLTPSLWPFAIHSQNTELIKFFEDMITDPQEENKEEEEENASNKLYEELLKESIKCHHNDIANYFLNNYFNSEIGNHDFLFYSLEYYNFEFIKINHVDESLFIRFFKYDYYILADLVLKHQNIDVNKSIICIIILMAFHLMYFY